MTELEMSILHSYKKKFIVKSEKVTLKKYYGL